MLILEDGARAVFEGLVSAARGAGAPTVRIAGFVVRPRPSATGLAGVLDPV
ncbi:MAG: hypothetical protein IID48_02100 [Proteobacteria bacterium]|nr:hypothetical protein [Pseudomonadota bacterium]